MEIKRIYKPGTQTVDHVEVRYITKTQKITQRTIDKGLAEGWMSIGNGMITLKSKPGDVSYKIVRIPGYYCCHTNVMLDGEVAARRHVAEKFDGKASPDPANPAGYRKDNFYYCELVEA